MSRLRALGLAVMALLVTGPAGAAAPDLPHDACVSDHCTKGNVGRAAVAPEEVERVKREIAVEGARFSQRVNLNRKTAGEIAGVLTQFRRIESGEDTAGQLGRIA